MPVVVNAPTERMRTLELDQNFIWQPPKTYQSYTSNLSGDRQIDNEVGGVTCNNIAASR